VVLTPWAACQDPAQLRQLDPQVGSDAITVAYIDNGVARGATLLIEMYLTGVSMRRVEAITEKKGIN
jgi:hypothetical protein